MYYIKFESKKHISQVLIDET